MEFRLLGELEVLRDGQPLAIRGKSRAVVAQLLLDANRAVGVDEIIGALWPDEPPATARQTVQYFVHRLRRLLADPDEPPGAGSVLVTTGDGYLIRVEPEQLDTERFRRLAERARSARTAGNLGAAASCFREALALWRGPALADFAEDRFAQAERIRLEGLRLRAIEDSAEVNLELGRHVQVEEELGPLVRAHPWRERLRALHILALYRVGRQSDALAACRAARRRFLDELGIEPGAELQRLERDILARHPALDPPGTARPAGTKPAGTESAGTESAGTQPAAGSLAASTTEPAAGSTTDPTAGSPAASTADPAADSTADHAATGQPDAGGTVTAAGQPADDRAGAVARAAAGEERKVVTALVAELVEVVPQLGDTEDRVAMHARMVDGIQREVRRYDGTVHTVLGRTLLAVFGAARVREDDPERAVRAALAVAAVQQPGGLAVRVGVETGAAVVAPAGGTESGPLGLAGGSLVTGITGTALDTASYLGMSAAPGTVLVGAAAHRVTVRQVEYQPVSAGVWQPVAPRSVIGTAVALSGAQAAPLVDRDLELGLLERALARVREDLEPQLLTLIGAPGIGKSRLVAEFANRVDADPELITWRQARSVPYGGGGEGVTLWALAEVVRAQAGILEADPADVVDTKLHEAVAAVIPDAYERAPIEQRLRPLVQSVAVPDGTDQRRQLIDGWARFMAALADDRPVVVVVEDLQWADQELLDCLDGLLDQVGPVPLLIVCTTRPELLDVRPDWGGGKRNSVTVSLTPLTDDGSGRLLDALLAEHGGVTTLSDATRTRLLAQAGGIPLYLEEYVRILHDQASGPAEPGQTGDDLPLPETAHQIISARLDALPLDEKILLQNMAVLGEVGWRDPLVALTGMPADAVDDALVRLTRHDLVRLTHASRRGGPREYVFRHALVRDVAYEQLLRAERADKHRRVAEWLAATRGGDRAEQVAHHYQQAIALTRAAGWSVRPLSGVARLAFWAAGDRAAALGALTTAIRYYAHALELWPDDDPERAELLFLLGQARAVASTAGETELLAARDLFQAAGDWAKAAEACVRLGLVARLRGDAPAAEDYNRQAMRMLGSGPPSRIGADLLLNLCGQDMASDRNEQAIQTGRKAIQLAAEVGAAEVEALAHGTVGAARLKLGDLDGLAEMTEAGEALHRMRHQYALMVYHARAQGLWRYGDTAAAAEALDTFREVTEAYNSEEHRGWVLVIDAVLEHAAGRWDDAVRALDTFLARPGVMMYTPWCLTLRAAIRLDRGDVDGAQADAQATVDGLPPDPFPEAVQPAVAVLARALAAAGDLEQARVHLARLLAEIRARPAQALATTDLAVLLVDLDEPADALPGGLTPIRWHHAARAFAERDFAHAAELYGEIGALPDQALAQLYHARQLVERGHLEQAAAELPAVIEFWAQVGAAARQAEAQALLDRCRG